MGPNWGRQDPGGPHVGPMNSRVRRVVNEIISIAAEAMISSPIPCGCDCLLAIVKHIWRINIANIYRKNTPIIGSYNGLSPGRHQAIIWSNDEILLISNLSNKLQWNLNRDSYIFVQENAFENVVCEMAQFFSASMC